MEATPPPEEDGEEIYLQGLTAAERRAFEHAVTKATLRSTQNISRIHRIRLITQSAGLTALIVGVVAIIVVVLVTGSNQATTRQDARFNCRLFTGLAAIMGGGSSSPVNGRKLTINGKPEGFVSSDAALRKNQQLDARKIAALRPGALKRLFQDPQTATLNKKSRTLDSQTFKYWDNTLVPALQDLARINCAAQLP